MARRQRTDISCEEEENEFQLLNWKKFNGRELYRWIGEENKAVRFAKYLNLIDSDPGTCPGKNGLFCGEPMVLRGDGKEMKWTCTNRDCYLRFSYRKGTFFEGSKLDVSQILTILYYSMVNKMSQRQIMHEADVGSEATIVDWASFIRECYGVVLGNICQDKIGGPGLTVEIDESHVRARKFDVGRVLKSEAVWAFGGICRETKECFLVPVVRRDADTLLPLIEEHIEKGTHIISDMWRVYGLIPTRLEGYTHSAVNHSQNFVDPGNEEIHTQTVENMWGRVKQNLPRNLSNDQKGAYFNKFMYEQKYKWPELSTGEKFKLITYHISKIYCGPFKEPWTF